MEDTLNVYHRADDPSRPMVCLDEASKQLVKEVRQVIPAASGRPEIIDDEYERNGTGNLCMLCEPLAGRRDVLVTERRTAQDYAHAIKPLVDVMYPGAEKIVLVQDNLNTHKPASLYEAFTPDEARRLIDKLEIHDTLNQQRNADEVVTYWQFAAAHARVKLKRLYPVLEPIK